MDHIGVLLADDDARYAHALAAFLGLHDGVEVVGVSSTGKEAVSEYRRLHPDVVVLDVHMPEMDGVEAARIIVEEDPSASILMLSVDDSAELRARARDAGASDFVSKQDVARDLLPKILGLTHGGGSDDATAAEPPTIEPTVAGAPCTVAPRAADIVVTVSISLGNGG